MAKMRVERVAEQIRGELSEILIREASDPRLRNVGISRVKLSRDLQVADVYFSVLSGDEAERSSAATALERASSMLRRQLGGRLRLKYLPALRFHPDRSVDHALHIDQLLSDIGVGEQSGSDDEE